MKLLRHLQRAVLRAGYPRIQAPGVCSGFWAAGERAESVAVGDRLTGGRGRTLVAAVHVAISLRVVP